MKNLSMISKPQTGYTVKKVNAKKARAHAKHPPKLLRTLYAEAYRC